MRRRERSERVHGPYQHGRRWRVALVGIAAGPRRVRSFATEREANAYAAAAREQASSRTVGVAVEEYLRVVAQRGLKASSLKRLEYRIDRILDTARTGAWPIKKMTTRGPALYARVQAGSAVDTHRLDLAAGKAWGKWCVERGWLARNPFDLVVGVGRRKRGKPQLRTDEARRILDVCLHERSAASIAVACALLLGTRASELTGRAVRDLDNGGKLLWIPASKTDAGRRILEIPEVLRQPLLELAGTRPATARLFGDDRHDRHWLWRHCRRLCLLAGVPVVPPHGLRGTQASIATQAGATAAVVSAALGHSSTAITAAHYVDVTATETARSTSATAKILGTPSASRVPRRLPAR